MAPGINSSICVAGMGMGAAEKSIAVIGNNLSNANTVAFKSGRADFATLLYYNMSYGSEVDKIHTAGSNPVQIGMGVQLTGVSTNFSQGAIDSGMGKNDLAISGEGLFIAQYVDPNLEPGQTPQNYYTRNGILKLSSEQRLTTQDGLLIMGYGINENFEIQTDALVPLDIPINKLNIAAATQNVEMEGILDAVGPVAEQGTVLRTKQMTDMSWSSPGDQKLTATQIAQPDDDATAATGTTGGAMEAGSYLYRLAYVDANGVESDYSEPVGITLGTDQNAAQLTDLPTLPASGAYANLRVYRAVSPDDTTSVPEYHLVAEFDPAAQNPPQTYTDTQSTAAIADAPTLEQGQLSGSYTYYVTFIDADGNESRPSAVSNAKNVNGGQLLLNDLPVFDPDDPANADLTGDWTGRRIYRSTGTDSTTFYQVGQIDNMDAAATLIDRMSDAELVRQPELNLAGKGNALLNEDTLLLNVGVQAEDGTFKAAFQAGTLYFQPEKGDTELKEQTLEIDATTTMRDYLDFLDASYGIRPLGTGDGGIPADQGEIGKTLNGGAPGASIRDGALYLLGNAGEDNALTMRGGDMWQLTSASTPGDPDAVSKVVNDLGWTSVQDAAGTSTTATLLVYDSLGAPVEVNMTLVLEKRTNTETTYRWYADSADNQPGDGSGTIAVGTGQIKFGQNGELLTLDSPAVTVERTGVASESPATFTFNLEVGGVSALATGTPSLTQASQDGAGAGTLWDYEFLEDGTIMGVFSSGVTRPIGQIVLATFVNPEGLVQMGENLYAQSMNSGPAVYRTPGNNGAGVVKSYSLEMSNTDIASDLIDMILASAMYRASTKVLTTSTEMFDELMRIR